MTKKQLEAELKLVSISAVGLSEFSIFIAHERGNWGPEHVGSDYRNNQLQLNQNKDRLVFDPKEILQPREQFKLIVPNISLGIAYGVYAKRMEAGVHVGDRMDYDMNTQTFWLLADPTDTCKVVALGQWNQNNIWIPDQ